MAAYALLAQVPLVTDLARWAIIACVVAGIAAIAYAGLRKLGWEPSPFIAYVFWVIVVVLLCVFGIKILVSVL